MTGFEGLTEVIDLVDEEHDRLRRLLGSRVDAKGVRALLEEYILRAWQRGAHAEVRPLPRGVYPDTSPSKAITPIESPRVAIEVNVADHPLDLETMRRRRGRDRGEP